MNHALVVAKIDQVAVDVNASALAEKQTLLGCAAEITDVTDDFGQACAVDCLRGINTLLKLVEKSRTEVKAPVLDIGRKIDSLAKGFSESLAVESARINKLVTDYHVAERKKAEDAERARLAELQRIETANKAAEEAERKRLEELRKAEELKETAFNRKEAAQAEAARVEAERLLAAERQRHAELEREKLLAQSAVVRAADKPAGLVVKEVWKFEVLNIWDLARDNRDLVRLEPNTAAINEAVRGGMRRCPGLRIYSETVTGTRQ